MWEVTNKIEVNDEAFFKKISLGIKKDTYIQIGNCFYHDFVYDKEFSTYTMLVTVYLDEDSNDSIILSKGLEAIQIPNAILTFLTGYPIGINHRYLGKKKHVYSRMTCTNSNNMNVIKISRFNQQYVTLNKNDKEVFERIVHTIAYADYMYYKIDCKDEAAFNSVKALEIISSKQWNEKYGNELDKKRKKIYASIVNEFEQKLKTEKDNLYSSFFGLCINDSNVKGVKGKLEEIIKNTNEDVPLIYKLNCVVRDFKCSKKYPLEILKDLVKFRNDFAHGNIVEYNNNDFDMVYSKARYLASELISQIFFNISYSKLHLKLKIEYYSTVKIRNKN